MNGKEMKKKWRVCATEGITYQWFWLSKTNPNIEFPKSYPNLTECEWEKVKNVYIFENIWLGT